MDKRICDAKNNETGVPELLVRECVCEAVYARGPGFESQAYLFYSKLFFCFLFDFLAYCFSGPTQHKLGYTFSFLKTDSNNF